MFQKIVGLILDCASQRRHLRRIQQRQIRDLLISLRSPLVWVAEEPAATLGVESLDVQIKRIDLPSEVSSSNLRRREVDCSSFQER